MFHNSYKYDPELREKILHLYLEEGRTKKSRGILYEKNRVAVYQFIQKYHETFSLKWLFRKFNLSPNAYYNYLKDRKSVCSAKKAET